MPDHLRINRKRHYRQTEQDEEIGSLECCSVAKRNTLVFCSPAVKPSSFSLLRCSFGHTVCETTRAFNSFMVEERQTMAGPRELVRIRCRTKIHMSAISEPVRPIELSEIRAAREANREERSCARH